MNRKIYIVDTSVIIHNAQYYQNYPDCDLILPIAVLGELDKLKKGSNEAAKAARVATRFLDKLSDQGDISKGITLENNSSLKVDATFYNLNDPEFEGLGDKDYGDTSILACLISTKNNNLYSEVSLLSNDINLRVKAKARGIKAERYEGAGLNVGELFTGHQVIVNEMAGLDLQKDGCIDPNDYKIDLLLNECVSFEDSSGNVIAMGRKTNDNSIKSVRRCFPWGLNSRNREQTFAIDMLLDKNIDLVTLTGRAGCGKSLICLAVALELVLNKKDYEKLIIYRPIQPVGNDIGYLPGPQPLDAKILTPNGWSTMGNIQINDSIIGSDGLPKKVLNIFPKGKKEVFKVKFSDGTSTECCEDHLWFTHTLEEVRKNTGGSVKSLKQIIDTLKIGNKKKLNNHRIPIIERVSFEEKNTVIDPYIMGVLLGDGTLSENYSVYFTSSDEQMFHNCASLVPNNIICKIKNKVNNSYNYSFINPNNLNCIKREDNIFAQEIVKLGLRGKKSRTKFIPNLYKFNSVEKRISILQGLMDTDGFVNVEGSDVSFSSTSKQLAEDVQFLVQSLGGTSNINKKHGYYDDGDGIKKYLLSYIASVSLPSDICPFRLDRKIKRYKPRKLEIRRFITNVSYIGIKETKCILVDSSNHLYATDNCILTHNTMEEKLEPWFISIVDSFELLFGNKNNNSSDAKRELEMYQKKGRIEFNAMTYIRGRSINNAIILLDEAQNVSKADIKTLLTRAGEGSKIIITGDLEQIDAPYLSATDNGLIYVIDKFKNSALAGHLNLTTGERSRLATLASEIL